MLSINKISKSFIQRGVVLDELSLEVSEGDSISVMGPSGSGKTTLLNIIGLLDRPDKGSVIFRGNDISGFGENESAAYRNRQIGFVFQEHLLLPHLTVYENASLPLMASKLNHEELRSKHEHLDLLMEKMGIRSLSGKYPFQISGGEAQRVALVRALANNPSLLLADEPTGSLDSGNADLLGDLLAEMNRTMKITVIVATHSDHLSGKMSRQMKLQSGKLV
jgi:ABC-type lipoprotein export system ATPase subunit